MFSLLGLLSLEGQYISGVLEYRPAPGQFINEGPWGVPSSAGSLVGGVNGTLSLGAFGGYVVFRFEDPVENHPDNPFGVDFTIFGNPLPNWSEPGVVWVMPDENGNGEPDESWYELAGSDYWFSSSRKARVEYEDPATVQAGDVPWEDDLGQRGFIRANSVHGQAYYPAADSFPDIPPGKYVLEGSLIEGLVDVEHPPVIESLKRAFGYADNQARGSGPHTLPDNPYTPEVENSGGDAFDISWAVDAQGESVDLESILFVKVQTGILHEGSYLGEISTEITGAVDVAPDPSVKGGSDHILVLRDLPVETTSDTLALEVFCFKRGRPVEVPGLEWTTGVEWARVDENRHLVMEGKGELELTVRATGNPELRAVSRTRVVEETQVLSAVYPETGEPAFYPNPASGRIFFREAAELQIYNLSGRLMKNCSVVRGGGVDCSDLPGGVYLVVLVNGTAQGRYKLVIR